jgi:hypothetical protein
VARAPKQCGRFGCPELVIARTYCDEHLAEYRARHRSPSSRAADDRTERTRRKQAVDAWVAANGWQCPGWRRDPHPSRDLTAAHAVAVARGGGSGPLTVLCRSCNSRQLTTPT